MNFGLGVQGQNNLPMMVVRPPLQRAPIRNGTGFQSMFNRINVNTSGGGGCGCGK